MEQSGKGTNRRTWLQKALLLLGGTASLGGLTKEAGAKNSAPAGSEAYPSRIYGKFRQFYPRNRLPWESGKGRFNSYGELLSRPDGVEVGSFHSTRFCLDSPHDLNPVSAFNVEFQTLSLKDGTVFGMGGSGVGDQGERVHAIVGGTGRYAGARGSYTFRQAAAGDGVVEFVFTFLR